MKSRARSKAAAIRAARNRTGNRPDNTEPLNRIDERVIGIIGDAVIFGLSGVRQVLPRSEVRVFRSRVIFRRKNDNLIHYTHCQSYHLFIYYQFTKISVFSG